MEEDGLPHGELVVVDMEPSPKPVTCAICLDLIAAPSTRRPADAAGEHVPTQPSSFTLSCSHEFCFDCIKTYVAKKVDDRQVEADQLTCPIVECQTPLTVESILHVTTEATFLKYMRFVQLNQFERMPHGRWCPRPNCNAMIDCDPTLPTFQCTTCHTKGCFKCGSVSHPFRTCHQAMDAHYRAWEARQRATSNYVQPCPGCGVRIWKNDGCNHMTCTKCRHEWCWICRWSWSSHSRKVCQAVALLDSPYWGTVWPVRFLTKTIAAPVVVAGGAVAGAVLIAGCVLIGVPRLLYEGLKRTVRQLKSRLRHRDRTNRAAIALSTFSQQLQHGVHVYIYQDDTEAAVDTNGWLRDLTTSGRWRQGNDQYVQYVQPASATTPFVSYLSNNLTLLPTLEHTPNAMTLLVLHRTMELPSQAILRSLLRPDVAKVVLVLDAPPEEIEATVDVAQVVATLTELHRDPLVLTVPNQHPTGAFDATYLSAIYAALYRLHAETW
ncbi:hypothetical protein H310_03696 [Aphanomyces invadans]|uniref:RBR-type E3 ubiquitin transferase n=1 Tax=Aphanomyces invadans TaxID=157072 RepID=A0A024UKF6_9STRA|nr:hypothetical protein H310_03696 [Aphanomyces invadans]ETW06103.1 hypothetical protein H310_03696 [Aphanomyces invadans]|eukprot:XP_008865880.1 hypothetical protein H310_03696 [Aphanomyces invadans]